MTKTQKAIIQSPAMQALAVKAIDGMNVDRNIGNPQVIALANAVAVSAGIACSFADRPDEWDICECEHVRDDHEPDGKCMADTMERRAICSCPRFKLNGLA